MSYREEDLPGFFADFGVPVTIGGVTGLCLLDENDLLVGSEFGRATRARGEVRDRTTGFLIITSVFPALEIDQPVTINDPGSGGTRTGFVADHDRQGDGATTHIDFSENTDEIIPPAGPLDDVEIDGGDF